MTIYKGERQRQFPTSISTTNFVKLYILHLLMEDTYYGNKIKDEISKRLDNKWSPSPGMIYPLLRELEKEGLINGWWNEPQKRSIRKYKITEEGIKHYNIIKLNYKSSFNDSMKIIENTLEDIYKIKK